MTDIVGGIRTRLIFDSVFNAIQTGLTELGWIGGVTPTRYKPIQLVGGEQDVYTEVPINTVALLDENVVSTPWEVGSQMTEDARYFYVDFFAESDALGKHVIGDIRDMLLGKIPATGITGQVIPVYDWRMATPTQLFSMDVINVRADRSHQTGRPWLRHWYSIQFQAVDYGPATGVPS